MTARLPSTTAYTAVCAGLCCGETGRSMGTWRCTAPIAARRLVRVRTTRTGDLT